MRGRWLTVVGVVRNAKYRLVTYGPAPRPLDRYETKLDGSKLMLGDLRGPEGTGV